MVGKSRITLFADVDNFTNLLNKKWGQIIEYAFPYNIAPVRVSCLNSAGVAVTKLEPGVRAVSLHAGHHRRRQVRGADRHDLPASVTSTRFAWVRASASKLHRFPEQPRAAVPERGRRFSFGRMIGYDTRAGS